MSTHVDASSYVVKVKVTGEGISTYTTRSISLKRAAAKHD